VLQTLKLLVLSIATLFCFSLQSANAEWIFLTASKEAGKFYINNKGYIIGSQGKIKFWQLHVFPKKDRKALSAKSIVEADCVNRATRPLEVTTYSGSFADGKIVEEYNYERDPRFQNRWSYAHPGSIGEAVLEVVCTLREIRQ